MIKKGIESKNSSSETAKHRMFSIYFEIYGIETLIMN